MTEKAAFQGRLGYVFKRNELLQEALTHRSVLNENGGRGQHNERLEFLGDSILNFLVAEMLFSSYPSAPEGELTQLRSALVKAESLASIATRLRLGDALVLGKGEEATGGRTRVNTLCDAFEALVGALYQDGGLSAVQSVVLPMLRARLEVILREQLHLDARSLLQEKAQAERHLTPRYIIREEQGKEHSRAYVIQVVIGEVVYGEGTGSSKRSAAQAAARAALDHLMTSGW
jgi:ribonuclease-3